MAIGTQRERRIHLADSHWGICLGRVTGVIMALLLSLATSTSAQAATFPATFKFINYASVGQNNVWCSGTDAGIVMRCAVQNWAGSAYIVNNCVETSRYIAPGSLGIGGNTYGGNVYGTCNVHAISPPQDWIFQVSERSVVWVALQNIHVCPTGSTWTGDATYTCQCNDPAATTCGDPSVCPAHAHGTPCACDTGYQFDAGGTSCVQEQYTLALTPKSGTTEPWHKKHDKEHLKANIPFKAIVKDQNDKPKADFAVTITTDVTSDSGGHVHTNGRPKGKLVDQVGAAVKTKDGKVEIKGTTNGSGVFEFTFGAEEASGTHTLTAKCDSGCKDPATATVDVGIPSLIRMGYDKTCTSFYCLRGGLEGKHVDNHFYDWRAWIKVVLIAKDFKEEYGELFKINDSSLIKGGLYDINGLWSPSHKGHRKGIVVDINNFTERDIDFETLVANRRATAIWEDNPPHYHLRLLNNKDE